MGVDTFKLQNNWSLCHNISIKFTLRIMLYMRDAFDNDLNKRNKKLRVDHKSLNIQIAKVRKF